MNRRSFFKSLGKRKSPMPDMTTEAEIIKSQRKVIEEKQDILIEQGDKLYELRIVLGSVIELLKNVLLKTTPNHDPQQLKKLRQAMRHAGDEASENIQHL